MQAAWAQGGKGEGSAFAQPKEISTKIHHIRPKVKSNSKKGEREFRL